VFKIARASKASRHRSVAKNGDFFSKPGLPLPFDVSLPVVRESSHRGGESRSGVNKDSGGVLSAEDRQGLEVGAVLKNHTSAPARAAMKGRLDKGCVLCPADGSALIGSALRSGHEFRVTEPGRYVSMFLMIASRR